MYNQNLIIGIILIIILIIIYFYPVSEYFSQNLAPEIKQGVRLYEDFYYKNLIFDYTPDSGYIRNIFRAQIKSAILSIDKKNDGLDKFRYIKIWNINPNSPLGSLENDFYNPYTEADLARRVDVRYELLTEIKAGETITINFDIPVKRIFIIAQY